ncbi:hypothetical protein ABPG77_007429 [Micractinium sp. CCAP 211/92]
MAPEAAEAAALGAAVRACPFLRNAAAAQGEEYARRLAAGPLLLEDGLSGLASTLRLFHGPGGVVPLKRFGGASNVAEAATVKAAGSGSCPFRVAMAAAAQGADAAQTAPGASEQKACNGSSATPACTAARPMARPAFASLSISGFGFVPDPSQVLNRPPRARKQQRSQQQQQQRKPGDASGSTSPGGGSSGCGPASAPGSSPGASFGGSSGLDGAARLRPGPSGTNGWGQVLGGLIQLSASGHLQCPAPIVKMRAAVAALKPVRQLRPQALPIRALAMGGTAVAANLPCGMWREHTRKFSPQWFLAVHATIPFVAMLRKAVLMPKWAILLTVAGAIAGQNVGARMERERLQRLSSQRQRAATVGALPTAGKPRTSGPPQPLPADCATLSLDASCRRAVQAAQAALAWALAPTVVL